MERFVELLGKIDDISNRLLIGDKTVYDEIEKIFPVVGEALDIFLQNIEIFNENGIDIGKNEIEKMANAFATGYGKKDHLMLVDVLCFEIYKVVNLLVMVGGN